MAVRLPSAVAKLDRRATRDSSFHYDDREFAAGNSIIPDKQLLYEARALIPPAGAFRVVTGTQPIGEVQPLTLPYAATFATYFLMPRRPSRSARWILCLGCKTTDVAARARTVWSDGSGSSLLRVPG